MSDRKLAILICEEARLFLAALRRGATVHVAVGGQV
jgi:hypothetical protein